MPKAPPRMPGSSTARPLFARAPGVPLVAADVNAEALAGGRCAGWWRCPAARAWRLPRRSRRCMRCAGLDARGGGDLSGRFGQRPRRDGRARRRRPWPCSAARRPRGRGFGRQIAFNVIPQVDVHRGRWHDSREETASMGGDPPGFWVCRDSRSTPPRCGCRSFSAIAWRCTPAFERPGERRRGARGVAPQQRDRASSSSTPRRNSRRRPHWPPPRIGYMWAACAPIRLVIGL